MNIKRILFAALCCVMTQVVLAQAKRISGMVTDADGPVMMANVIEVDAGNRIVSATQTDFNGNFSMQVKSPKNKLKFSCIIKRCNLSNLCNNKFIYVYCHNYYLTF